MASKKNILSTNEIYHVFNRSIGKVKVFDTKEYLDKIISIVDYYRYNQLIRLSKYNLMTESQKQEYLGSTTRNPPIIEIYSFSFMPNHLHFQLKQLQDNGISRFLSNIQNSFAKHFNLKNDRDGGLFQRSFKAKRITNNEEFIHVNRYIHLNPVTSKIIDFADLMNYEWTSLPYYLNKKVNNFINFKPILDYFKIPEKYLKFLEKQVNYQRKLKKIKDLFID